MKRLLYAFLHAILWTNLAWSLAFAQPDRSGSACWTRFFGTPGSVVTDIAADESALWVTGRLMTGQEGPRLWAARMDWRGNVRWQQELPPRGYQLYPRLVRSGENMWVVAEVLLPSVAYPGGGSVTSSEVWLGLVSGEGKLIRHTRLAPNRVHTVQAATGLGQGGIILAGLTETKLDLKSQGWLAGVDSSGTLIWQRILPDVAWISAMQRVSDNRWMVAGHTPADQSERSRPWLAIIDQGGRVQQSWAPDIQDFSLYAVLPDGDNCWLAGEWTATKSGARLLRFDRPSGHVQEYPASGFAVLRLLTRDSSGVLAGGDGLGEAQPDSPDCAPGWIGLPDDIGSGGRRAVSRPVTERLRSLAYGELRAWSSAPSGPSPSAPALIGAGASPTEGAWVGCIRPDRSGPASLKLEAGSSGSGGAR